MLKTRSKAYWLFLAPDPLGLLLVVIVPMLLGLFYSFTNWNGLFFSKTVGFSNYVAAFHDSGFMNAFWFTVRYAIVVIIAVNVIGLGLALLVTQKLKGSNILRTVFFMPNLIGGLILGFIWQFIFVRVFAAIGTALHLTALTGWLSNPQTGFWGLVILTIWQMSGYIMLIYIAYLEAIPQEILEAAEIDGTTPWQRFRYITFPMVAPAFTVSLFLTLSNSFKIYDQNLSLTNGGPYLSTQMLSMNIVRTAFTNNKLAYGEAKGIIFFLVVAAISLLQVYFGRKREAQLS